VVTILFDSYKCDFSPVLVTVEWTFSDREEPAWLLAPHASNLIYPVQLSREKELHSCHVLQLADNTKQEEKVLVKQTMVKGGCNIGLVRSRRRKVGTISSATHKMQTLQQLQ